jgi:hypothetical protein
VITAQVLYNLGHSILHVGQTDFCRSGLFVNEFPQVLQLRPETGVGAVIQHDEEFEIGVISLGGNPFRDLIAILSLIYHDIFTID